jgi:transposase
MTHTEVSQKFVASRTSVVYWVASYNAGGVSALKMNNGGRPEGNPKWDPLIFDALTKELDKGGRYWSIPLMQQWIKEKFQKDIPANTVWYHVTGQDYSYKSARPHPYRGDAEKQEVFKKRGSKSRWKQ